jgi:hypothetical protein
MLNQQRLGARSRATSVAIPKEMMEAMYKSKLVLLSILCSLFSGSTAWGSVPNLGTASNFAVLAGSTITSTGTSVITGDVGVSPGSALTGFPPGVVTSPSVVFDADSVSAQAESDASAAYTALESGSVTQDLTGQDLGGLTLAPGIYNFDYSSALNGTLTLDGSGEYTFLVGSSLVTASNSSVSFENGAASSGVYWQIGSSATLGADSQFAGTIIANTDITMDSGSTLVDGRALALNGAVTLNDNVVTAPAAAPEIAAPAGMSIALFASLCMALVMRKRHLNEKTDL